MVFKSCHWMKYSVAKYKCTLNVVYWNIIIEKHNVKKAFLCIVASPWPLFFAQLLSFYGQTDGSAFQIKSTVFCS